MREAFGYIRVSGKGQLSGEGFARQREDILKYAEANGLSIVRWFEEKAVPGKTEWEERPAWVEMVQELNGVNTIVIERLDRLARDLMVQEHIIADMKAREIELISTCEPDLGSEEPTRILMRQIFGAIAQYDKAMIVLKLRHARNTVRTREGRCEGRKPYGDREGEQEIIAYLKMLRSEGLTFDEIASVANDKAVPTRTGRPWHGSVINRILSRANENQ